MTAASRTLGLLTASPSLGTGVSQSDGQIEQAGLRLQLPSGQHTKAPRPLFAQPFPHLRCTPQTYLDSEVSNELQTHQDGISVTAVCFLLDTPMTLWETPMSTLLAGMQDFCVFHTKYALYQTVVEKNGLQFYFTYSFLKHVLRAPTFTI
jgi:hypothetical protein